MLVMGDREVETERLSPRQRDGKNLDGLSVGAFVALIEDKCRKHE